MTTKKCNICGTEKDLSKFGKRSKSKDGHTSECRECRSRVGKEYRSSNKERIKQRRAERYLLNKEEILEKNRIWRAENKDAVKAKNEKWYSNNKERLSEYKKNWIKDNYERCRLRKAANYAKDPQKVIDQVTNWRKDHPEEVRAIYHRRRARKLGNGGSYTSSDIKDLMAKQNYLCPYCSADIKEKYHIDHILPLVLGGSNGIENIQLLCPTCNLRKGGKHPEEFLEIIRETYQNLE